jgi:hypothetical protein
MLAYLRTAPSPLGCDPFPYDDTTIYTLLTRLRPYELTKAEILMLMNLRPANLIGLDMIVEECGERFPDEQTQEEIITIIMEVLGAPEPAEGDEEAAEEGMEVDGA